jgi:hypothetical protein
MSITKADSDFAHRDLYSGLIRLHVLHHAAEGPIFGLEMTEELARQSRDAVPAASWHGKKGYLRSFEKRMDNRFAKFTGLRLWGGGHWL